MIDSKLLAKDKPTCNIHACDFDNTTFGSSASRIDSSIQFKALNHETVIPFEDHYFDYVIGSGVLEHCALERESLKEVRRILKDDGIFIITFLPNRYSWSECLARVLKKGHHRRLYSIKYITRLLLNHGFVPMECGYHQLLPSLSSAGAFMRPLIGSGLSRIWFIDKHLGKLPLLQMISANIYIVAQRKNFV